MKGKFSTLPLKLLKNQSIWFFLLNCEERGREKDNKTSLCCNTWCPQFHIWSGHVTKNYLKCMCYSSKWSHNVYGPVKMFQLIRLCWSDWSFWYTACNSVFSLKKNEQIEIWSTELKQKIRHNNHEWPKIIPIEFQFKTITERDVEMLWNG